MVDLQKVLACIEVHGASDKSLDHRYVAAVAACTSFSSKITVAMSANSEWRRAFGEDIMGFVNERPKSILATIAMAQDSIVLAAASASALLTVYCLQEPYSLQSGYMVKYLLFNYCSYQKRHAHNISFL
jgi:hypothetical protein